VPELPEVETIRRGLQKQIVGKTISKITIKKPNLVKQSGQSFRKELIGKQFGKADRIGKLLIFPLHKTQNHLLIHLKMTGQLVYCDDKSFVAGGHANSKKEEEQFLKGESKIFCKPGKYTHIIFEFTDGSNLFFNDLRQFGMLKVVNGGELKDIKSKYGIEPGRPNFTLQNFRQVLKNRKTNIKALLLNQGAVSGLGNIYVDEALFASKIHPQRPANSLTANEQKRLFNAIGRIIKLAIKNNGTTFSDFIDSKGKKGNFKQMLKVYGRQKLKCTRKNCSSTIKKIKVAGRGTHFCPECQKIKTVINRQK
jgi:formamidopyrimidine-DNA glycosylase